MAAWIVQEEIGHLNLTSYQEAAATLLAGLTEEIGAYYRTDCPLYGDHDVPVKYFLWVKTLPCDQCGVEIDLFPGYLLSKDSRHPRNVLVCAGCGALNEVADLDRSGDGRGGRKQREQADGKQTAHGGFLSRTGQCRFDRSLPERVPKKNRGPQPPVLSCSNATAISRYQ